MSRSSEPGVRRHHGSWRATVDLRADPSSGARRQRSKSFATKREAVEWRRDQLAQVQGFGPGGDGRITLGDWAREWIDSNPRGLKPETLRPYGSILRMHVLDTFLATIALRDLDPQDFVTLYSSFAGPEVSTIRYRVDKVLGAILSDAIRLRKGITRHPILFRQAHRQLKEIAYWSADETRTFLDVTSTLPPMANFAAFATLVRVGLNTGLRPSELLNLQWVDVRFGEPATVSITRASPRKTRQSRRTVDVDVETARALMAWREAQPTSSPYLWTHDDGRRVTLNSFRQMFDRAIRATGVKAISLNGMRHTHAVLLLTEGWDIYYVSQRLGHSVRVCEESYADLVPGGVRLRQHQARDFAEIVSA